MAANPLAASKKNAARRNGAIFFEDEVGFSQQGTTIRTWAPLGAGAVVDSAPGRSSIKAFGAVEYAEAPRSVYTFAERLNGASFVEFLQALLASEPRRPIYLVLDGARYHHGEEVKTFLATLPRGRLLLAPLPAYSPDLNPAEFIWRETKRRGTHNRYFPDLDMAMIKEVRDTWQFFRDRRPESYSTLTEP